MTRYKLYFIFVAIMAVGLFTLFFVSRGYYPIALVGNTFVSARTLSEEYQSASLYYQNMVKTYGDLFAGQKAPTPKEIEASTMEQLIENILIHEGAVRTIGAELHGLVDAKIGKYANDAGLRAAGAVLYGLDGDGFVSSILTPQAERDVLASRFLLEGKNIDEWLAAEKKSARVIFFSPQFAWDGEGVISK
jgi:hypothetical protein